MTLYGADLAYIQAAAYGGFARGAAPEVVRRLRSAAVPVRRVADVGCGAGVLAAALVDAGFEVTGIDVSAELIAVARTAVPGAKFVNASVWEAGIPACEAVVAVGEPLTYHDEAADADGLLTDLFRRVSRILPAGGMFIFDVIETGEPPLAGRFWSSGDDWAVLAETTEDGRRLLRNIETFRRVGELYRRGREIHRVRLFDAAVLCEELLDCGFVVQTAQAYGEHRLPPRRRAFFCTRVGEQPDKRQKFESTQRTAHKRYGKAFERLAE